MTTILRGYAESKYKSIYDQERDNANVRIEKHWNGVGRKQNLARKLRVEKNDLDCMQKRKYDEAQSYVRYGYKTDRGKKALDEVKTIHSRIQDKTNQIKEAESAPTPVIQPLPNSEEKAMKVLFFMFVPDEFIFLSRVTFPAQTLLLPRPCLCDLCDCGGHDGLSKVDIYKLLKVSKPIFSWKDHYDCYQRCGYHTLSEYRVGKHSDVMVSMQTEVI